MKTKDRLRVVWSKQEECLMFHFPLGIQTQCDAGFLNGVFSKEFLGELGIRGYDIKTIRFSIEPQAGNTKFASQRKDSQ